ncbi:MAG: AAA family ATPase [Bacteroidales bacterium]|nr:AAA family ATPase [Bacteroidales bacterium]
MIQRIDNINDFGFFINFQSNSDIYDFERYNLIYGWNGSGKSTLSKFMYCLIDKTIPNEEGYRNSLFKIHTVNGELTEKNLDKHKFEIKVFNEQFIKDNIDWDRLVKSLLYVSKGKVEDKKNLESKIEEYEKIREQTNKLLTDASSFKNDIETFLTETGKIIKREFEVLKTDDNKYINYNKGKLRPLIRDNKKLRYKKSIVKEKEIDKYKLIARLEFLDKIDISVPNEINFLQFENLIEKVNATLKTDVISDSIAGLKNNVIVSKWIEEGVQIHKKLKKCKFCGSIITKERWDELNAHFNENFKKTKTEIQSLLTELDKFKTILQWEPPEITIYPFLKEAFQDSLISYSNSLKGIIFKIESFEKALNKKLSNPFDLKIKNVSYSKTTLIKFNKSLQKIQEVINHHNTTTETFVSKVYNAKIKLELYYAHKEIKSFKYFEKLKEIIKKEKEKEVLDGELPEIQREILRLEASLTDEILGAAEFNTKLHRFLNHSDIRLKFDNTNKGYQIIRKNGHKEQIARHLSEGEKTAISFVFFLTKLQEDEAKLKKSIVVIDDPISSFDSNHLFNAYSFIRNICNDVRQLIILTHNFNFFLLVREWITRKNEPNKGKIKSRLFNIQAIYKDGIRQPELFNADDSLLYYNSEYHYLFSKLKDYRDKTKLTLEECFVISNIARKVLEIFLNFKFPKRRNDFYALLNEALKDKRYEIIKERIYRFINKYSHGDKIESFDDTIDNVLSESKNIVKDVLKIIERLDNRHFDELIEITNS